MYGLNRVGMKDGREENRSCVPLSLDEAMNLLVREPGARAVVFEHTWQGVDRARQRAEAAGLDRRLSVHHRDACAIAAPAWRCAMGSGSSATHTRPAVGGVQGSGRKQERAARDNQRRALRN